MKRPLFLLFPVLSCLAAGVVAETAAFRPGTSFLYIPNRTDALRAFRFDAATAELTRLPDVVLGAGSSPSTLAADPQGAFLYVNGWTFQTTPAVAGFAIDGKTGSLTPIPGSPFPRAGTSATGMVIDATGRFLYIPNNVSQDISAFAIDRASGRLTPVPGQPFRTGAFLTRGCMAADPLGRFMYLVATTVAGGQFTGALTVFHIDSSTGALNPVRPLPLVWNPGYNFVVADPSGRFIYIAGPETEDVVGFAVDQATGDLLPLAGSPWPTGARTGSLAIDSTGKFIFVGNPEGTRVLRLDTATGRVESTPGSYYRSAVDPVTLAVDPTGQWLFVTDSLGYRPFPGGSLWTHAIDPLSGGLTDAPGSPHDVGSPSPITLAMVRAHHGPPVAAAGADPIVECAAPLGTTVRLDGSGSYSDDLGPVTFEWRAADGSIVGTTAVVDLVVPLGARTFTLAVADSEGGSATDTVDVVVQDTIVPTLTASAAPAVLWPPDHRLVPVAADPRVLDACDAHPAVTLTGIGSDDADMTPDDVTDATIGTDDRSFMLRRERKNDARPRAYRMTYSVRDASGNTASATTTVVVPGNQSP